MWHYQLLRAWEIVEERRRETDREQLRRLARQIAQADGPADSADRSRLRSLRRSAAVFAANIARRLDECVARETLEANSADGPLGAAG